MRNYLTTAFNLPLTINRSLSHSSFLMHISNIVIGKQCKAVIMARKKNSSKNAAAGSKQLENACSSNPIPLIESESHTPSDDSNDFQHPLGEKWTLKDIFSIAQLQSDVPPKCHDTDCVHVACAQWLSSTTGETWNLCIDCNRKKFGGWPKNLDEYPITFVTEEHRRIMCQLCSSK